MRACASSAARAAFDDRAIAELEAQEVETVAEIYGDFSALLRPVGPSRAIGLLNPCVFPLWDKAIAIAYIGHKWSPSGAPAAYYGTFGGYCIKQCTTNVSGQQFGHALLKMLDEWNFCVWTKGWIPEANA